MPKVHNKKRNIGIIYELLLRSVSSFLIEGKTEEAQKALNIIDMSFAEGTSLYKEFRLFNALANSTVSDTSIAAAILSEAKSASRRYNSRQLDTEKSQLIKDINYNIKDKEFYSRKIPEYKLYATIQILLNEWRKEDNSNLTRTVEYESKIVERLLESKSDDAIDNHTSPDVDELVSKIMMEKFNSRYDEKLNSEQKNIVRSYVFLTAAGDEPGVSKFLKEISESTLETLEKFESETENKILLEKLDLVRKSIQSMDGEKITDSTVAKFLTISQLKSEILESK